MRRKDENLRVELLGYAKDIAVSKGYDKISIRALAKKAGIASGTVYNYFGSKDEILLAMTDEYWYEALENMGKAIDEISFYKQLEQVYSYLCKHILSTASKLMSSLSASSEAGGERMRAMHMLMGKNIINYLEKDTGVREDVWTDTFTKEGLVDFIIKNIMFSLRMRAKEIDFLVEIVRRTIY